MYYSSIKPMTIEAHKQDWPKDRYCVRNVNGDYGQHWAVCDIQTLGIVTLSYTEAEANAICALFNKKGK